MPAALPRIALCLLIVCALSAFFAAPAEACFQCKLVFYRTIDECFVEEVCDWGPLGGLNSTECTTSFGICWTWGDVCRLV